MEKSVAPLKLALEPSPTLCRAIALVHGLAVLSALANGLPAMVKALLVAAIAWSFHRTRRDHCTAPRVLGVTCHLDGRWEVLGRDGATPAQLLGSTCVTPWLVVLHLASGRRTIAIPICRDSVDPDGFRRLRVALRCRT
ncbi:protein YgfX [Candidatus Methylocalor cossyra]|uniref:Toxin CptA n=1 Tax=Candidatus Methylocalor cossyra TaxID=3108543 RepID=A0ABM9NGL8_9GAMM